MSFNLGTSPQGYPSNRRGSGGRPFNRQQQTQISPEDEMKSKLTSLIVRIGDKASSALEGNIDGLVSVLVPDLDTNKATIQTILMKCISQLPYKTTIYASIVGKMNIKNHEFGKEMIAAVIEEINDSLKKNNDHRLKLLIRFISCLVLTNTIAATSLFELYDTFLSILTQENYTQAKADYYVYTVLSTLPWVGSILQSSQAEKLNNLFEEIDQYMQNRSHAEKSFYQSFADNDDPLELLLKQIKEQKEGNWECDTIIQIYKQFDFSEAQQHPLPQIQLPTDDSKFDYPNLTRSVFRIFDDTEGMKPIDRHIIEDYIVDILYFFNGNHKDAAKFIYSLPVNREIDHIVVETILSEAFKLPKSEFKSIYYSVMFVDLFKDQHQTIIPVFAYAINTLFENLDHLDTEVTDRFSLMFAHHLSNFEYKWVWSDWAACLAGKMNVDGGDEGESNEQLIHLQKEFLSQLLESIVRLSYLDKIKQILPTEYHSILPELPNPNFKFYKKGTEEESKEMVSQSHKLLLLFKTKEPLDSIINHVANIPTADTSDIDIFELVTKCILNIGSTSFSHLTYAIERYVTIFKSIIKTQEDRLRCLSSAAEFWKSSHQHIAIVIDKFITYKILLPIDPITFYLSNESNQSIVTKSYVWEIVYNSIDKTNIIIEALSKDYESQPTNEKELKLKSYQNDQQVLFQAIFNGLCTMLKNPQIDSKDKRILAGHLKSVARKYFKQVKSILENQQNIFVLINEYTQ